MAAAMPAALRSHCELGNCDFLSWHLYLGVLPVVLLPVLQALKYEPSTHIVSTGALATLSGAKTGRSPR